MTGGTAPKQAKTTPNVKTLVNKVKELETKNAQVEAKASKALAEAKHTQATTHSAKTVDASHAKVAPSKPSVGDMFKSAGKFLLDKGLETLITLGPTLLASEAVQVQKAAVNRRRALLGKALIADNIIPAGTILANVPISPSFAQSLDLDDGGGPNATTRLQQKADLFLRYRFKNTKVRFQPAAGALNNGQIGFFIPSDPRTEITASGLDAVRLVEEYKGAVTNISQPADLKVPTKGDWLFVNDNHESDTRFTQQGMLWIIAFTDLVLADGPDAGTGTTSSLGAFNLSYDIELKDDAVSGSTITPALQQSAMVFQGGTEAPNPVTTLGGIYWKVGTESSGPTVFGKCAKVFDTNNSNFVTTSGTYNWTFPAGGVYWVEVSWSGIAGSGSTTSATPASCQISIADKDTSAVMYTQRGGANQLASTAGVPRQYPMGVNFGFYLEMEPNQGIIFLLSIWDSTNANVLPSQCSQDQLQISFTQLSDVPPMSESLLAFRRGWRNQKRLTHDPAVLQKRLEKYIVKPQPNGNWLYYDKEGNPMMIEEKYQFKNNNVQEQTPSPTPPEDPDWVEIPSHPHLLFNTKNNKVKDNPAYQK